MKITPVFCITFILLLSSLAVAQEQYSFSESIDILLRHNAELKSAEASVEGAKNQLQVAYGGFLPEISAGTSVDKSQANTVENLGYGAEIVLKQNLFNGFRDFNAIDVSKASVESAEASLRAVKASLSYDLKSSFANLLYAHEYVRLTENIQKRRSDNYSLVQLRFQSGRENKGSVMLAAAYLQEAGIDLKRAQLILENAKANFLRVLGLPPTQDVDIKGGLPESQEPTSAPVFLDLVAKVPSRISSAAAIKTAEAAYSSSFSDFMPSAWFEAKAGQSGDTFFPNDNNYWQIKAGVSWTLFSGGKSYFTNKTAFASKLAAENNLRNLDLSLAASLRSVYSEFLIAIENYKVSQAFVDAQNVRAEIGRSKYNNGLSAFDDWDVIENDLINRQRNLIERRRDKVIAEAAWEKAQGRGVVP